MRKCEARIETIDFFGRADDFRGVNPGLSPPAHREGFSI